MPRKIRSGALNKGVTRYATGGILVILLTGCARTTMLGDAGCMSYAEARLDRPAAATITGVPDTWANWIADLDDRMTGTCQ